MFLRKRSPLMDQLKKHPGEILATASYMAVLLPHDEILMIPGDFSNMSAEETNVFLQDTLAKMMQ